MVKISLGRIKEATQPDCIQALIVEFITTFLFIFAGVASAITAGIYLSIFLLYTTFLFSVDITIKKLYRNFKFST